MQFPEPFAPFAAGVIVIAVLIGGAAGLLTAPAPAFDTGRSTGLVPGIHLLRHVDADTAPRGYLQLDADVSWQCGDEVWGLSGHHPTARAYRDAARWLAAKAWDGTADDIFLLPGLPPTNRAAAYHPPNGTFAPPDHRRHRSN